MLNIDSVVVASSLKSNDAIVAKVMNREKLQRMLKSMVKHCI